MKPPRRRAERIAAALLLGGLVLATWPAWRVLFLGTQPTLAELLQLICTTTPA